MKNLYEILQVSENASNEIIEKAYKVLAKKYHPDLQPPQQKEKAEQKMKQINEAYEILGNEVKRKEYDAKLELEKQEERKEQASYNNMHKNYNNQNNVSQAYQKRETANTQEDIKRQRKMEQEIKRNMQAQYEQKYQEAYEGYLRSLGYKIKYKWTWKNYRDLLITILVIIGICATLWFLPPTNKMIVNFYESNHIVKTIVDIIGGILKGIWNAICSIFTMSW